MSLGQNPEDRHLPTIDLTQSAEILTTGTDRHLALFDKCTLVDNERGIRAISDQLIGITRHMVKHFTCAPFRVSDKLLQISTIGVWHYLRDRIDIFTRACLHQAGSILPSLLRHISPVTHKVFGVTLHKTKKSICHPPQGTLLDFILLFGFRIASPLELTVR